MKRVKIRSQSSPWINNEIRRKMNLRFKLFKRAVSPRDQEIYARYKKVRNEITPQIRIAKAQYCFCAAGFDMSNIEIHFRSLHARNDRVKAS